MEYDLKIVDAVIVNGSGMPRFRGEIGVKDGMIVAVGAADGDAGETIDAGGAVVRPRFIDCYTHCDAQICWDDMLAPSVYHGVTAQLRRVSGSLRWQARDRHRLHGRPFVAWGEPRPYADAVGILHVIVQGVPVARCNSPTGRKGGRVLRSGRHNYTVPLG